MPHPLSERIPAAWLRSRAVWCVGGVLMLLLSELAGRPLAAQDQASTPQWIWTQAEAAQQADSQPVLFRRLVKLAEVPEQVHLTITCDNRYELVINNVRVGQGENWQQPQQYRLKGYFQTGNNVVIVRAKNDADQDPAGLAVSIDLGAGQPPIVSDASWQWQAQASDRDVWWTGAEDGKWQPAVALGSVGSAAPWGDRVSWSAPEVVTRSRVNRGAQASFEFVDGDRVTWIGNTWVERQQTSQYFETLVTSAYPDREIRFRNLGWSGDDVFGTARAVFGTQEDGFRRLRDDLLRTEPTVILVGYGANEAYGGPTGLDAFRRGYERLMTLLDSTGAEVIFVGPTYLENLGTPLPDPTAQNANVDRYSQALQDWCEERGDRFIDFRRPLLEARPAPDFRPDIRDRLTDNGVHFTPYGYWRSALTLAKSLNVPLPNWSVTLSATDLSHEVVGGQLTSVRGEEGKLAFEVLDDQLPYPAPPEFSPRGSEMLGPLSEFKVTGLPEGRWGLNLNGEPTVIADHETWAKGVKLRRALFLPQVEALRTAIAKKNDLYFHRYRPQNETYLFLFRKHEQGNNAVEVPQFDALTEAEETRIDGLKVPKPIRYELLLIEALPE